MDFRPSEDQRALTSGIRDLLAQRLPTDKLFAIERGFDAALWRELTETGVFALRLPEADGGLALGLADAALLFEELGAALVPGPLVATHLAASLVPDADVVTALDTTRTPWLVSHLESAHTVILVHGAELRAVSVTEVAGEEVALPLDPLTPLHEAVALPTGEVIGGADQASRWGRDAAVLTAAYQVGIAGWCTQRAVAYAKEREQFGRPVGSFQAVKHICADMLVRAEVARAAVESAALTVDQPEVGDVARAVAGAKVLADEAATLNARSCVQVHGGMGFTWEVPVHLYLKRAWLLATEWGNADDHAEVLAALL